MPDVSAVNYEYVITHYVLPYVLWLIYILTNRFPHAIIVEELRILRVFYLGMNKAYL